MKIASFSRWSVCGLLEEINYIFFPCVRNCSEVKSAENRIELDSGPFIRKFPVTGAGELIGYTGPENYIF